MVRGDPMVLHIVSGTGIGECGVDSLVGVWKANDASVTTFVDSRLEIVVIKVPFSFWMEGTELPMPQGLDIIVLLRHLKFWGRRGEEWLDDIQRILSNRQREIDGGAERSERCQRTASS